jgi:transcription factor SPT20
MIVELLDYRPKKAKDPPLEKPERSRVALHPNDETLWANLCLMNQRSGNRFTDTEVLELEAQILVCYIRDFPLYLIFFVVVATNITSPMS